MNKNASTISKREEEYLEAMYILKNSKGVIRVKDLSKMLGVKPASVVDFLERMARKGLIVYEKRDYIALAEEGEKIATRIYDKHRKIREFLETILLVPKEVADKDACYMEHHISRLTLDRMVKFVEFVKACPRGIPDFLKHFEYFCEHGRYPPDCRYLREG